MLMRDISAPEKKSKDKILLVVRDPANERTAGRIREVAGILGIACFVFFIIIAIHLSKSGLRLERRIVEAASQGFESILEAATELQNSNFENAEKLFLRAEETFKKMQNHAWFTTPKIPTLNLKDPLFESTQSLIIAGSSLATAGRLFTKVADDLRILPKSFFEANVAGTQRSLLSLTEKLRNHMPTISEITTLLFKTNAEIQKIPESFIPGEIRERFRFSKEALSTLEKFLSSLKEDIPAILTLLGDKEPHTFLILLQNNSELRPTGGFIGNYLIIETNDGYVTKNAVFDVYSSDHKLTEIVSPPPEILPVNTRFYLRDSNYSAHFPLSAEKAAWFLEKETGPGVDTVIAIDQTLIANLLEITGPIKIPELKRPFTSSYFDTILSYIIESKLSGKENPKTVLQSFIPAFQKALFETGDPVLLSFLFMTAAKEKHLLAYSKDTRVQDFFERHGMAGLMKDLRSCIASNKGWPRTAEPRGRSLVGSCGAQPNEAEPINKEDYLALVHTSISGNKSDKYIAETITHDTYLNSDGSLINELSIARTHQWSSTTEKNIQEVISSFGFSKISDHVFQILGRSRNIHMLRIYVPTGSLLEHSSDSSLSTHFDEETRKTYFSAQLLTPVGETRTLKIRYRLPFTLNLDPVDKYSLIIQKQAGQSDIRLIKRIFPESRVLNYKYFPESGSFDFDGVWNFEDELKQDMSFASVWGK